MLAVKLILLYPLIFYVVNRLSQTVAESRWMPNLLLIPLLLVLIPGILVGIIVWLVYFTSVFYTKFKKNFA